jgi:hypothetical protein
MTRLQRSLVNYVIGEAGAIFRLKAGWWSVLEDRECMSDNAPSLAEMSISRNRFETVPGSGGKLPERFHPALRSFSGASGEASSSSHSNESARAVVSMGSSSGISSATDAPSSANLRAETSTRLSSDPTALL